MEKEQDDSVLACMKDETARLTLGVHLCIQFVRTLSRRCDDALAEHGMGRAHHRVLFLATRDLPLTVGEMGAMLGISNQALSFVASGAITPSGAPVPNRSGFFTNQRSTS